MTTPSMSASSAARRRRHGIGHAVGRWPLRPPCRRPRAGARAILGSPGGARRRGRRIRPASARPRAAPPPPAVEDPVVHLAVVAAADEHGRTGGPDLLPIADVDERQGAGEVDRRARGRSRGPAARSARPNPTASPSSRRPSTSRVASGRRGRVRLGSARSCSSGAHARVGGRRLGQVARATSSPRTCRMSSSYLRTTPSVSSTSSGRQLARAERQERRRPVERLGDARAPWSGRPRAAVDERRRSRASRSGASGTRASTISNSFWAVG